MKSCFNTQPPEGGWNHYGYYPSHVQSVSTHSRPKAAGSFTLPAWSDVIVSTHSRPKAAGPMVFIWTRNLFVSTHSRPKAAGSVTIKPITQLGVSTHSRPKAAGKAPSKGETKLKWFQHTAARRRMAKNPQTITNHMRFNTQPPEGGWKSLKARIIQLIVSTHSRPKAAG